MIKKLEAALIADNYPEVYKFARRLATISIFTKYGESVDAFHRKIEQRVKELGFNDIHVTHSSVAVDILPIGFDKFTGLRYFAEAGTDSITVGIADSMNDVPLLIKSGYAFMPRVSHQKVIHAIESNGKKVVMLQPGQSMPSRHIVIFTEAPATLGVAEILSFIASNHNLFK